MSAPPHVDPDRGVFETMLVFAGRAVELDAHIGRLTTSVNALYGSALPGSARELLVDRAGEIECGKLRLTVTPARGALQLDVSASEIDPDSVFPSADRGASLRSRIVAAGLGEHKWADRDLLDRLMAASPGELPLLLDADGTVLEASRASVFVIREEKLVTPPTDGRILPSIARQQAIETADAEGIETREERLTMNELRSAEVFLTGSVRGVEPVRFLDGAELTPPSEVSERIAGGLRRRWMVPAEEPAAAVAAGQPSGRPGR
jgi:para-aminobenzoate synthetase/4-amino-4-deoxychorismate lyase